jgi:amino acid permease
LTEKVTTGRIVAAIVFALIALSFFTAGAVLATTPADQLPGFLGHDSTGKHHTLRGIGSLLVGLVFTAAAWFAARYQSLALEEARAVEAAPLAAKPNAAESEAGKASEPAA